uniref:Transmembrane protein n=1 Tax=Gopherus agassizii TaxID=38772 RepID=A0A452HS64_9SAUR
MGHVLGATSVDLNNASPILPLCQPIDIELRATPLAVVETREVLPLQPPHCFVLLSLFSTFFCNVCCLGFTALVFSFKARDRKVLGDTDGAGSNGKTAKCLNIAVLVLGCSVVLSVSAKRTGVLVAP